MASIRVFLADDHKIFLEGLERILNDQSSIEVVGTAKDGREAVRKIRSIKPDVAVLDINMPHLNGIKAVRLLKRRCPKTNILILSMHEDDAFVQETLEAGASGYILKGSEHDELVTAIQEAHRGCLFLNSSIASGLRREPHFPVKKGKQPKLFVSPLSPREREVLSLYAKGQSNQVIADSLGISPNTVKTHRRNMMKKLGLHRLADLIRYAYKKGIVGENFLPKIP